MNRLDMQDERFEQLNTWLDAVLPGHDRPVPASSDASFRRYFRVFCAEKSWIVMDAPPDREDCGPFIQVSERLAAAGVRVPEVHARSIEQGFLLLDDLGDTTLLAALPAIDPEPAYHAAIDELLKLQSADPADLPPYDEALLRREMALFKDWYLAVHRSRELNADEALSWNAVCDALVEAALSQARVFVHRDYHSRNLMFAEAQAPGVLDFQDAVHGPITYDLVSLLRDCYVAWAPARIRDWLDYYRSAAVAAGLDLPDAEQFQRDFDWMGIQRHLKAAGIFARLNHRDGKSGYLADIPRTLNYIAKVSEPYPELAFLRELVRECLN